MANFSFTEATIHSHVSPQSWHRGEEYYRREAVVEIFQRGNTIQALVEGNEPEPYSITLEYDRGGIKRVDCTCQYSFGGWCKHIVAVALVCLRDPQQLQERPPLSQILSSLSLQQTRQLLEQLLHRHPELQHQVDRLVEQFSTPTLEQSPRQQRKTSVNPAPFASQTRSLLRETREHWEWGGEDNPLLEGLEELITEAKAFTHRGDGTNAIAILTAITDACASEWDDLADYGGDGQDVGSILDPAWAAAILSADLSSAAVIDTQVQLEEWGDAFGSIFNLSTEALRQGWGAPALVAILQGDETATLWPDGRPDCAEELDLIRLEMLDRQGQLEAYLNLAKAEGLWQQYLSMLIQCDRVAEAVALQGQLTRLDDAFEVAKVLREREEEQAALEIAVRGLTLPKRPQKHFNWYEVGFHQREDRYYQYDLADWASELAEGLGKRSTALTTRITAFKARPSQTDYHRVRELAGNDWEALRSQLLDYLRQLDQWSAREAKVDIFLEEGLVADAIATMDHQGGYDQLLLRVMQAAIPVNPQWVIERAQPRAEDIMNRGKADAYDSAVLWLEQVKAAYDRLGQAREWQEYRDRLQAKHGRKHKLMGLMKAASLI